MNQFEEKAATEPSHIRKKVNGPLVLLDFDGTITTRDTLVEFVRFYRGKRRYWLGLITLAPVLVLYKLRILPNWRAKEYFLAHHFKGERVADFNVRCQQFSETVLQKLIRPGAIKAIEQYKNEDATLVVVSASAENWVKPWCDSQGIVCLATRLEAKDGRLTGRLLGRNCYDDEKACRVKEQFDIRQFKRVVAYGDSSGDKGMFALAHEQHYKPWRIQGPGTTKSG